MKRSIIFFCLCAAAVLLLSRPVSAWDAAKVQALQRIIEAQQKQLDEQQARLKAQQEQLEAQKKLYLELRQQLSDLSASKGLPPASAPEYSTATPSQIAATRRVETQTQRRDKEHPHDAWTGSFGLEGVSTRLKIGGFAELDAIHDTDAMASKAQFIPSTIATRDTTNADGAEGQTNFSVNPSRLFIETRTPIKQRRLTTYLSVDFFADGLGTQPDPRMRQAYGEMSNILFGGDLLVGQAWSTFADLEAFPNVLDFQGPNSFFGTRQPMVRWTRGLVDGLKLMLAVETPDNHIVQEADSLTTWPDGVLSLVWDKAPVHLMGSFLARDLRASLDNGQTDSVFGWGGSVSGKIGVPFLASNDFLTFSATYGEGIGSAINDQPPDAVFDSTGTALETIPLFGWFASYEHRWSEQFKSVIVYGSLEVDNLESQPLDSFYKTQYASANVVWQPSQRWLIGIEGLWGQREDKDGENGTNFRTQFTSRFTF